MLKTGTGTNLGFETEDTSVFANIYAQYEKTSTNTILTVGQKIEGVLIATNSRYSIIDINNKSNVIVEMNASEKSIIDTISIGDTVSVIITDINDTKKGFTITGSLHKVKMVDVDSFLNDAAENRTVLTGTPVDFNQHGYTVLVNINDEIIALFMPHLLTDVNKLPDANSILDTEIEFILDKIYKDNKNTYVVSRKKYLNTLVKQEIKNIVPGEVYEGFITGTTSFAIFVQFGVVPGNPECLTGMIHKSNLNETAAAMLEKGELLNGQRIEFFVKDKVENKLFLTQVLRESLWDSIQVNDILLGKVSVIKPFGVLVDLDYESKGLIHDNKLNGRVFKAGEEVKVYVTKVDKTKRQITLALYNN